MWDLRRLRRVVDNLLSKAIKYCPYGRTILVTLGTRSLGGREWALLAVRDEGIGIRQDDVPHVFDPYPRGANVALSARASAWRDPAASLSSMADLSTLRVRSYGTGWPRDA
jgi:signal transduction histidine kinase